MVTRIVIARHGNTFKKGQIPTRVGAATDLPLVEEHRARSIGKYVLEKDIVPQVVFAPSLKRTMQTATLAMEEFKGNLELHIADSFKEIDYGPDENKTENEVIMRLGNGDIAKGEAIINAWNTTAKVPPGWEVSPDLIIENWKLFAANIMKRYHGKTTFLVSSNGIMRFAPHLTGDFEEFANIHDIKVSTGGVCIFEKEDHTEHWKCIEWNTKPYKLYPQD